MLPILNQSYWRDEAFSVLLSTKSLKEILLLTIKDTSPPLYYFLLHFWMEMFGDAEYVTRTLSLSFHILLVISSFFLIKYLIKNWKLSLIGSMAVLLNPFLLEYAFETRCYSFFAFLIVTATYFFLKRKYFISSLFLAASLVTHSFGIFFLFTFVIFWIYQNKGFLFKKIKSVLLLLTLPFITFGIWFIFLWNQWVKVAAGFWIGPKDSSIFLETFRTYFQGSTDYISKGMIYNLAVILTILGIFYWFNKYISKKDKEVENKDNNLLIFLFSIPFLVVYLISAFWIPIFHERYLMPILPIFIIWIIYSLFKLSKLNKPLSYFIFAISISYIIFLIQGSEEIAKKTTKPAINYGVQQALSKISDNDVIIPESELNFLEVKYYVKKQRLDIPIYTYLPNKNPVFYIGSVLFEENEIIDKYPENKRIWIISKDGGSYLKTNP